MMVVRLEDRSAQVEVAVYSELLDALRERPKADALLLVRGKVQRDQMTGGVRVIADELLDLATVRARFAAPLRIAMNGRPTRGGSWTCVACRVADGPACAVVVHYENGIASCDVALGPAWRVRPDEQLISALQAWLEPKNVQLDYGAPA
jgi:DNA polymerase-3 subunit alpha